MESLTSSSTSLGELEGISERIVEKLREAGIENVERLLELGVEKLEEIPGVGEKTAAKIMDAARDLFEEVEIEVPEGIELPTAIRAPGIEPGAQQGAKPKEPAAAELPPTETLAAEAEKGDGGAQADDSTPAQDKNPEAPEGDPGGPGSDEKGG